MAVITHLETDTGTNVDISAATAVGAYTANADKLIMVDVSIDAVAGNGDYVMYVTRQIGGSGSAYRILPQTTMTADSGLTAISAQSGWITVRNGDVLTCYVDGLAGDTTTPDWSTRWFESAVTLVTLADDAITAASVKADAVTKIQSGLALEATLTAIKGAGWNNGTLQNIKNDTDSQQTALQEIKGEGWTDETLTALMTAIEAISAGSGATAQEVWGYATRVLTAGTNIDLSALATAADLATVDTVVDAIKAKTDNLPADPAAVGSAMTLTAAYDKAKDDVLTPLAVVDGIVDAIKAQTDKIPSSPASAGEYTTNIGAIKAKTDNLPLSPASSGEYTSALTAIQNDLDNPNQYKADVSNLALQATSLAIKGQTDKIPAAPAQTGEYNAALTAIQADLDNPDQYKADVSGIPAAVWGYATRTLSSFGSLIADIWSHVTRTLSSFGFTVATNSDANVTAIKAKTDNLPASPAPANEYDAELAALQADLDNADQYKADVSGLATQASVNAIPTTPLLAANYVAPDNDSIAAILEDTGTTIPATLAGLATSTEVGAITMLDEVVVGSYTMQDILKILAAKMVGKATGGGTATITYRGVDDTSDVIIETVDSNGNRSAVTLAV